MQALLPAAAEALGQPITVLVNNASIFEYDNIETATRDSWDRHLESNLRAPFVLSQAMAAQVPEAARREWRASGAGPDRQHDRPARAQADAGIHELHDRQDGALGADPDLGAGAGPACPGQRHRPGPTMQGARQSAEHFARQRAATVLGRGADPEGICAALDYLLQARAVTGQLICVDGGQHLVWQTPDVLGVE
jgi:NAD(P)-dependent dehydrogenase (short-subunit alcohol dehydrogenase family)